MSGAWTGGQWSLVRAALGIYLTVHFAALLPWGAEIFSSAGVLPDGSASPLFGVFPNLFWISDSPAFVLSVLAVACAASLTLAAGVADRAAAVVLWLIWASLYARNPLISNPGLPYVGLLLVVHALQPAAPFGSLRARGRLDPSGGWQASTPLLRALWVLMAAGYSFSGLTKLSSESWRDGTAIGRILENPLARPGVIRDWMTALPDWTLAAMSYGALGLELLFAPLALIARARPWLWVSMLAMHLGLIVLIDFADLSLGMVLLHLATFDPSWVKPRRAASPERFFYDGECGLCHGFVRFLLAEDPAGRAVRFSPLSSATFQDVVPEERRPGLPDSVVLQCEDGRLLTRSDAILRLLRALGGVWGVIARLIGSLPRGIRDAVYDRIAAVRRRVFARPDSACPMLPPHLAERFDH